MKKQKPLNEMTTTDFDHVEQFGRTWNLNVPSQRLDFAALAIEAFAELPDGGINMGYWFVRGDTIRDEYGDADTAKCYACAGGSALFYAVNGMEPTRDWERRRAEELKGVPWQFEFSLNEARCFVWASYLSHMTRHVRLSSDMLMRLNLLKWFPSDAGEVCAGFRQAAGIMREYGL